MPSIEALYTVEFGDVAQGRNGGVAVLETNLIYGGDSAYYYLGTWAIKDSQIEANVRIVVHNPTLANSFGNAFGDASQSFTVKIRGTVSNGVVQGVMERAGKPGLRLPVRLTWREDLP